MQKDTNIILKNLQWQKFTTYKNSFLKKNNQLWYQYPFLFLETNLKENFPSIHSGFLWEVLNTYTLFQFSPRKLFLTLWDKWKSHSSKPGKLCWKTKELYFLFKKKQIKLKNSHDELFPIVPSLVCFFHLFNDTW